MTRKQLEVIVSVLQDVLEAPHARREAQRQLYIARAKLLPKKRRNAITQQS